MTEKDVEAANGGGQGCCLDPALMQKAGELTLSPAFLSGGLQVTFKVGAERAPRAVAAQCSVWQRDCCRWHPATGSV